MALLWIEGWEAFTNATTAGYIYDGAAQSGTLAGVDGAEIDADEAVSSVVASVVSPVVAAAPQSDWIVGFAFRGSRDDTFSGNPYVALQNTDGEQIRIEFFDDDPANSKPGGSYYNVRLMRGATELAATDIGFWMDNSDEAWIYFEFKVTISNTVGSIEGRYSYMRKPSRGAGTTALTWDAATTNLDTQNQVSAGADRLEIVWSNSVYDDMYFCDDTGAKNNDYLGRVVVAGQKPSGDGNTTDWTLGGGAASTQNAWSETVGNTGDDLRLSSDTLNEVHLASVAVVPLDISDGATVVGVRQDIIARMETTGNLDLRHRYRKTTAAAVETDGASSPNFSTTGFAGSAEVTEDDPNTAATWVRADLDATEHGSRNAG